MALDLQRRFNGYRWRRYVPCLVFVGVLTFVQLYAIVLGEPLFLRKTFENIANLRRHGASNTSGPLHVLLVSYARTGSSFVGDLLQSLPDSFYHFEPLHFVRGNVLNESFVSEGRDLLAKVYGCNVTAIKAFMKWQKQHKHFMKLKRSVRYWTKCSQYQSCFNSTYIDTYCRKHHIVAVKTIRLKLKDAAELFISHPHLNLKIIYLSRDPRGALNSRMKFPVSQWCKQDPTCANAREYCTILNDDVGTICSLTKERPLDFHVLRYEDLSMDPIGTTTRLVNFLGMPTLPQETEEFLKTHTLVLGNSKEKYRTFGVAYAYSTFRNSSITAMSWRQQMSFEKLIQLQSECKPALIGLGYHLYSSLGSLRSNKNFDTSMGEAIQNNCPKS